MNQAGKNKTSLTDKDAIVRLAASHEHQDYYDDRYQYYLANPNKVSWNWSAFFADRAWLFYHKMYKELGWYLIILSLTFLVPRGPTRFGGGIWTALLCLVLVLGPSLYLGVWGNSLLFESLSQKIDDGLLLFKKYRPTHPVGLSIAYYLSPVVAATLCVLNSDFDLQTNNVKLGYHSLANLYISSFHFLCGLAFLVIHKREQKIAHKLRAKEEES